MHKSLVGPSFIKQGFTAAFVFTSLLCCYAGTAQAPGAGAAAASAAPATAGQNGQTGQASQSGQNGQNGNNPNGTRNTTNNNNRNQTRADRDTSDNRREDETAGVQDALTEFQQMVSDTTGRQLPIFGASLFGAPPSTFAPVEDVPVGPGYIIGPGDELRIQMSGQVNQQLTVTVDRTGAISLPDLGQVHVAGLAYSQLQPFLTQQANKLFRNFTLSVDLGALRSIQIFVFGNARRPGSYTISSLSTLLNALFASGGPSTQGSVRDIQVRRGGRTITHFDLYDLLLKGDKTADINLATGDVIFIPPVGAQVAVVGSVNTPAIYELKGETTIGQVLALSGGETNVANTSAVRLERIYMHAERSIEDVALPAGSEHPVQNGDILSVTSIINRFRDAVTLRGNVANPGRYVWHSGMHVLDLIPNREALITRDYWRKRNQLGQTVQDYAPNPNESEGALGLKDNATPPQGNSPTSGRSTTGSDAGGASVAKALTGDNNVFSAKNDVVLSAPDPDLSFATIERQSTVDLTTSLIPFNLGKLILEGDASQNIELLPGDVITIFSKADIRVPTNQQTRSIHLEGEFVSPGVYTVLPGETLRSLLKRVGGFTPDAYLYASEFTRESTRRVEQQRQREYADQLEAQISAFSASAQARAVNPSDQQAAQASAADAQTAVARLRSVTPIGRLILNLRPNSKGPNSLPDIALEDGDRFVVPRVPSNVNVEGQVYSANAFIFTPGRRVIDYLREAGGPDRQADHKRSYVLRADGSVISSQYNDVQHAYIFPGDTIVVPPIIDKRAFFQRIVDIATIIGQLGVAAGFGILAAR